MNYKKSRSGSVVVGILSGLLIMLVLITAGTTILTVCVEKQTVSIHVPVVYSGFLLIVAAAAGVLCALIINADDPALSAITVTAVLTASVFVIYLLSDGKSFLSLLIRLLTTVIGGGAGYITWVKLSHPKRRKYRNR